MAAGQPLIRLDERATRARLQVARAEATRLRAQLDELEEGPRVEEIERAGAALEAARATRQEAFDNHRRLLALKEEDFISQADIDRARTDLDTAIAEVESRTAALQELQRGTRAEQLAQGRAALARAEAEARLQAVLLDKLLLQAPRSGRIDDLPFRTGDEAPVGAPLVNMLVGEAPYARVYIPQSLRPGIHTGDRAVVYIVDVAGSFEGRVRTIRSEPSFTPYYALTGKDVSRLSYLAEIQLGADAAQLPSGLPLRAEFTGDVATTGSAGKVPTKPMPTDGGPQPDGK
ncbi:hemolysin secretion protein D [Microbulbifer sp. TT37]|uniref:HlyD family secretion protein n=1 Tax=Microbulbifer sediminum TaxID=2904250 RepID=UPI001F228D16